MSLPSMTTQKVASLKAGDGKVVPVMPTKLSRYRRCMCSLWTIAPSSPKIVRSSKYRVKTVESAMRALELLRLGLIIKATLNYVSSMEPQPTELWPQAISSLMRQKFFMRRGILSTLSSSSARKLHNYKGVRWLPVGRWLSMVTGMLLRLPIFVLFESLANLLLQFFRDCCNRLKDHYCFVLFGNICFTNIKLNVTRPHQLLAYYLHRLQNKYRSMTPETFLDRVETICP